MSAGDDGNAGNRAQRYRERAAHLRATAPEEVRPYRRRQRLAYAGQLDTLAAGYEAARAAKSDASRSNAGDHPAGRD